MTLNLSTAEKARLAGIVLENFDPLQLLIVGLTALGDKEQAEKLAWGLVPGKTAEDKIRWVMEKARPAFASDGRFAEAVALFRDLINDNQPAPPEVQPPAAPPAVEREINGQESGFLWKPIGENSKKLRVLLPPEWMRDKFDLNHVEIWDRGTLLETLDPIGPGNPIAGRGDREHFAGNKKGGEYPAGCTVRAKTGDGEEWEWVISKPASRNENVKARRFSIPEPAPVPKPTPEPAPPADNDGPGYYSKVRMECK